MQLCDLVVADRAALGDDARPIVARLVRPLATVKLETAEDFVCRCKLGGGRRGLRVRGRRCAHGSWPRKMPTPKPAKSMIRQMTLSASRVQNLRQRTRAAASWAWRSRSKASASWT